ncbi:MAG: magnesium transporter CorA family protein [Candidatus Adiutrix sp.]|jgi:magnesium transporter|nr:magnesium transporter CorA family protein [Candidatus Adiutrix sp.]
MLTKYEFVDGFIKPARENGPADWLDLSAPTEEELGRVKEMCELPDWFIDDALDDRERPHIDLEDDCLLIIARLSTEKSADGDRLFSTIPVGIIITPKRLITVCLKADLVKNQLLPLFQRKRNWTRTRLAFAVFHAAAAGFIANLERMEDLAGEAEARLRLSPRNEEILALLDVQKSLIDTTIALKTNHALMDKFLQPHFFNQQISKEELDILDDALTESQQGIFMADILNQVVASMSDAFGSVISNNLNTVMKFMAGVTIMLMLPTLVAGLYGMNVELPLAGAPWAFGFLCALSLFLTLAVAVWFAKKKWL